MKLWNRWYIKLILALIAMVLAGIAFIIINNIQMGTVIYETSISGELNQTSEITFDLSEANTETVISIDPRIESGWGEPDVYLEVYLRDPDGNILLSIGLETLFGGPIGEDSRQYEQKFNVQAGAPGTYTLMITPLVIDIEEIYVKVGIKEK